MTGNDERLEVIVERLRELANLGASWAATAFSQLIGHTVLTHVPSVHEGEDLEQGGEWSTGLCFTTDGDFPGMVAVFVTPATRANVVRLLLGRSGSHFEPSSDAIGSALREFGNILVSQTISAIANATGGRILTSVPELLMDDAASIFTARLPRRRAGGSGILVECELFDSDGEMRALLVFAPDPKRL